MKCKLGSKKIRRIEQFTGKKVISAFVRGGWEHHWAMVFFEGENYKEMIPPFVNYKTGEIEPPTQIIPEIPSPPKKISQKKYIKEYNEGWKKAENFLDNLNEEI